MREKLAISQEKQTTVLVKERSSGTVEESASIGDREAKKVSRQIGRDCEEEKKNEDS